jgi:hypothetical protein
VLVQKAHINIIFETEIRVPLHSWLVQPLPAKIWTFKTHSFASKYQRENHMSVQKAHFVPFLLLQNAQFDPSQSGHSRQSRDQ